METQHPEGGESPFIVKDDSSVVAVMSIGRVEDSDFTSCDIDGCGEMILLTELDSHIEMHYMEGEDGDQETASTQRDYDMDNVFQGSFDTNLSHELRNLPVQVPPSGNALSERRENAKEAWKKIMKMPERSATPASALNGQTSGPHRRLGVTILWISFLCPGFTNLGVEIRTRPLR
jgi:zinc finger-containing ubiquitin peptidase 1